MRVPLGASDYNRQVPKEARLRVKNRFFEENPVLNPDEASLIARPGLTRLVTVDTENPIRGLYSCPGTFDDDAFAIAGSSLYRIDNEGISTFVGNLATEKGRASFAAVANIEDNPEKLFIADGGALVYYMENGYARGTWTSTGVAKIAGETVRIDGVYYSFQAGTLDASAPAGTLANPWRVLIGGSDNVTVSNLYKAINASGVAGTDYSTALTVHPTVQATFFSTDTIIVAAKTAGGAGNIIVTTETSASASWGAGTLAAGGTPGVFQVPTPDDVGIISVAAINSYVICVPAQGEGVNGQFFWIQPGEVVIDPLDFATAERSPDPISEVVVFGDQFWLPGQTTTEVWYMTGDLNAPVSPLKGVVFDRGAWAGTSIQVKDSMITVDSDGGVFQISGGLKRVSRPDIEERIRKAIAVESTRTF